MAKMTKSQLLETIAELGQISKKQAGVLYDGLVELACKEVKGSGEFNLPGLGKLVKKQRAAREGRNPATGATISIPAKTVVKFRVAKAAKEAVL